YRLLYCGMNIRMPESCVNRSRCGTDITLWLNGVHPQIEDGVVTRGVCGRSESDCCYYSSSPIRVKACPGNYYVYEFVKPATCNSSYCADVDTITPNTNPTSASGDAASSVNTSRCSVVLSILTSQNFKYQWFNCLYTSVDITVALAPVSTIHIRADPPKNLTFDPCNTYSILDDSWRATDSSTANRGHDDTLVEWSGWYRLYLQGKSAQIPETDWCGTYRSCGGYILLFLEGSHPRPQDGIVIRDVYGSYDSYGSYGSYVTYSKCHSYKSNPIEVKACPGNYYVYRLTKPAFSIPRPTYCAAVFNTPSYDPCNNYTVLNQPWRGTNETGLWICDRDFNWTGWYRLLYYGMNIRMPESCVNSSRCGTDITLWLNGVHPQIEDGVVTRGVCGRSESDCCYYSSSPIRVKACPGNYYVYEFVKPATCNSSYCADVDTITPNTNPTSASGDAASSVNTSRCSVVLSILTSQNFKYQCYDPCNNYTILDQPWRGTNETRLWICDRDFSWTGWYRLLYYGMNIRMPESCVDEYRCGTDITLWLNGVHPQIKDGIVTRGVCGRSESDCCYYRSTPIRVKACPGNYYVYEFVKPTTCGAYCAADPSKNMTFDPCSVYSELKDNWRTSNKIRYYGYDDTLVEWSGWYRLYFQGKSAQIPETDWCWSFIGCGGYTALFLRGSNPLPQDGIVTREIYGYYISMNNFSQCHFYKSNPIQVKACPGDYYVYRLVKPHLSLPMPTYCAVALDTLSYDPCNNYTSLDQPWRGANETGGWNHDFVFKWTGWYRLLYKGRSVRMPESCVDEYRCGTFNPLWLNGPHPQIQDGIVTRGVCGNMGFMDCCMLLNPIRVKACPGNYYVYEFVKPLFLAAYCADQNFTVSAECKESFTLSCTDNLFIQIENSINPVLSPDIVKRALEVQTLQIQSKSAQNVTFGNEVLNKTEILVSTLVNRQQDNSALNISVDGLECTSSLRAVGTKMPMKSLGNECAPQLRIHYNCH
ncbi:hypothetical protein NFI96_007493, partial [Prochilodus magdalenae]